MPAKYYRVTASYDPKRMSTYDYKIVDIDNGLKEQTIKREIRKDFQSTAPWLKIYNISEISEDKLAKWMFRVLTAKPKVC